MSNKKATKRAMLTSILAICLCLVMLIGSTFAWFTDTASTGVNTIQSGTLKVDIVDTTDAQNSLKGKTLKFVQMTANNKLTTPENGVLWEPGATFRTEEFRIKNAGSLALKWKMNISGGITTKGDAASDFNLLNVITFYIVKKTDTGTEKVDLAAFEGQLSKQTLSDVYYLEGTMDTTAGNDYQGLSLDGVAITVYATQAPVEYDSNNNTYDKFAQYGERTVSSDGLVKATGSKGEYYGLDVDGNNTDTENVTYSIPGNVYDAGFYSQHFGVNSTFNGNGATFPSFEVNCGYVPNTKESTLVVSNLNVEGDLVISAYNNDVIINNCTAKHISVLRIQNGRTVTIDGCNVTGTSKEAVVGNNKYGIYITTDGGGTANVNILNSNISNSQSHAIGVNGGNATFTFNIAGNTFSAYGIGGEDNRAAFKIWGDKVLAPAASGTMNEQAAALANAIKEKNAFANLGKNCVVAEFYGATLSFN